jgi:hypothetical protein
MVGTEDAIPERSCDAVIAIKQMMMHAMRGPALLQPLQRKEIDARVMIDVMQARVTEVTQHQPGVRQTYDLLFEQRGQLRSENRRQCSLLREAFCKRSKFSGLACCPWHELAEASPVIPDRRSYPKLSQNRWVNSQYNEPDSRIAAGIVSTQAISRLRMVFICRPERFAAIVPATPDDNT